MSTDIEARTSPLERRWPWLVRLFSWYARGFITNHFHAMRLHRGGAHPPLPPGPLVVALSHPSWWDPLMAMALAPRLGQRVHVAPIEAAALGQYRFFERLGFFGIEPGTSAGYKRLLEVADQVLRRDDAAFWITPQGRFTDARHRPLGLRAGVGHLAARLRGGAVLPVALEYTFWAERLPEALAHFAEPILVEDGRDRPPEAWTAEVERRLTAAQDQLARASIARDEGAFEVLLRGRSGFGRAYDLWRQLSAALRGQRPIREHSALLQARQAREEGSP